MAVNRILQTSDISIGKKFLNRRFLNIGCITGGMRTYDKLADIKRIEPMVFIQHHLPVFRKIIISELKQIAIETLQMDIGFNRAYIGFVAAFVFIAPATTGKRNRQQES